MKKTRIITATAFVLGSIAQASTLIDFRPNVAGDGSSSINVTSGGGSNPVLNEVASKLVDDGGRRDGTPLPVLGDFGGAGLDIDGQEVTFTITSIVDYSGGSNAYFRTDMNGNGLGIQTPGAGNGKWFGIDGQEAFTLNSSISLQFEGLSLRTWNDSGDREFSVSSTNWINLAGVTTATGITFDSVTGTFVFEEVVGNVIAANDAVTLDDLVGANGPSLDFSDITVTNIGDNEAGIALQTMTFATAVAVPEPSSSALLGLGGMALLLRRRK